MASTLVMIKFFRLREQYKERKSRICVIQANNMFVIVVVNVNTALVNVVQRNLLMKKQKLNPGLTL